MYENWSDETTFIRTNETYGTRSALIRAEVDVNMQALMVGATLAGSMATAFVLQRILLEAWLRAMQHSAPVASAPKRTPGKN
jgi:hypothetical protein